MSSIKPSPTKPSLTRISIGRAGSIEVSIPVLTLGAGRPVFSVVSGIHGDEVTGLFVIERFLKNLGIFKGQVNIVPSAHPLAQAVGARLCPKEFKDLNRVFPGDASGDMPERVAFHLFRFLLSSDMVADIHSFSLRNPVMAIYMARGNEETKKKSLGAISAFGPDVIWQLDVVDSFGSEYKGALGPALSLNQVPNFGIEMPQVSRVTSGDIERSEAGLHQVMMYLGMKDGDPPTNVAPRYHRQEFSCSQSGIFFPLKDKITTVEEGERIGRIAVLPDFKEHIVEAPFSGMLLQIQHHGFVTAGSAVFAMGHPVDE